MKIFALLLVFSLASCATLRPIAADCAAALVTPAEVQAIETALSTDNYESALASLSIEFGSCVVLAGVQQLSRQPVALAAHAAASAPVLTSVELARAKAWLAAHPRGA